MNWIVCLAISVVLPVDVAAQTGAASLTGRLTDSATAAIDRIDSLYRVRDTTAFLGALQEWKGFSSPRIQIYRGVAAVWTGQSSEAVEVFDSLLDSAQSVDSSVAPAREPIIEALTSPEVTTSTEPARIPSQLGFIALLFALFLLPKALQRFRIPGAITSLLMGAGASALGWFPHDPTLNLMSKLGIVALFLFAGLEIDA